MEKVIYSNIDGPFHGWKSHRVYKLTNGEIWKQVEYKYEHSCDVMHNPKATIFKNGIKYFLYVEGMNDMIQVRKGKTYQVNDRYID